MAEAGDSREEPAALERVVGAAAKAAGPYNFSLNVGAAVLALPEMQAIRRYLAAIAWQAGRPWRTVTRHDTDETVRLPESVVAWVLAVDSSTSRAGLADRYQPTPFLVTIDTDGNVELSSGKPGHPAGDYGRGRITWRPPS